MANYQLLCWKDVSTTKRIKSAAKTDFTTDSNWDSEVYEIVEPGNSNKIPPQYDLKTHKIYYDTSTTNYSQGDEIIYISSSLENFVNENSTVTDTPSGISGPFHLMQTMLNRKELYNDTESPLYESSFVPIVGTGGHLEDHADRINNLEIIHSKTGWHNQEVQKALWKRPKKLLIYYGWLNSFNSDINGWDNEKISQNLCQYDLLIFGDGLQTLLDSGTHNGFENTSVLTDTTKSWTTNEFVGEKIVNITDGSSGTITANTSTTITATLSGGIDNDWDGGDVYRVADHADYPNTVSIINRAKALKPDILIFGYVTSNQTLTAFEGKADDWDVLGIHGIFMDECGYDYGETRSDFNDRVDYVHGLTNASLCFVNAWNMDHIIGTTNDSSYPNSTYNNPLEDSNLTYNDWYLLESFPINTTAYTASTPDGYEPKADWASRGVKAYGHRYTFGINLASVGIINNSNSIGQDLFNFSFVSSMMFSLDAHGSSDTSYGASSAKVNYWDIPDVSKFHGLYTLSPSVQVDVSDADVYWRFNNAGYFKLDFSDSAQLYNIHFYSKGTESISEFTDEFGGANLCTDLWLESTSGANSEVTAVASLNGCIRIRSGDSTNDYASISTSLKQINISLNPILRVGAKLDHTSDCTCNIGFYDSASNYIEFKANSSTGYWHTITTSGGSSTDNQSSVALDTNWHHFEIIVTSSLVIFKIDGNIVKGHTTYIPTTDQYFRQIMTTTGGSSVRDSFIDYVKIITNRGY